jgi:hypothetical protein
VVTYPPINQFARTFDGLYDSFKILVVFSGQNSLIFILLNEEYYPRVKAYTLHLAIQIYYFPGSKVVADVVSIINGMHLKEIPCLNHTDPNYDIPNLNLKFTLAIRSPHFHR